MSPLPPRFHLLHRTLPLLSLLHSQSQFTNTNFFLVKHLHMQHLPIGRPATSVSSSTTATGLHSLHGNNMHIDPALLAVCSSRIIDPARNVFLIPFGCSWTWLQWLMIKETDSAPPLDRSSCGCRRHRKDWETDVEDGGDGDGVRPRREDDRGVREGEEKEGGRALRYSS
ncbi:hypothetical protein VNO77_34559 [Canavalia gladiata]|uniref:Uncharacterized protein n=1 Tax=Canavalia gladiata TaxID=3824 RepID=A0AAN9KFB1_CANGL